MRARLADAGVCSRHVKRGIIGSVIVVLLAGGAWLVFRDGVATEEDPELDEDLDDWFAPTGSVADAPVQPSMSTSAASEMEDREAGRERWRERRREGRGEGRKAWRDRELTPEQRERWRQRREEWRERFRQRISVRAPDGGELSEEAAGLAQDDVFDLFGEARPIVRDCMRESGAERGLWRQARRESRQMSFDVTAEGQVNADTFRIEPPLPEPLASCFAQGFAQGIVQPPGPEGASVTVDLPSRRGRRGRRDGGTRDGG